MEQKCHECSAPLTNYKCDYCGAKHKKMKQQTLTPREVSETSVNTEQVEQQDQVPQNNPSRPKHKKKGSILSGIVVIIAIVAAALYLYHPSLGSEVIYVCHDAPTLSTEVPDVTTVITIESRGRTMTRWIEQDIYPRQAYINYYWGPGQELSNDDIRTWFEGPFNLTQIEGTYWELVAIDDDVVITHTIFDYESMSRADLDQLWDPDFSGVTRDDAIQYLESQGAVCIRQ